MLVELLNQQTGPISSVMDRGVLFTFTVTLLLCSNFVSNWPLRRLHFGLARPLFDLFYLEHNAGKYQNAQLRFTF